MSTGRELLLEAVEVLGQEKRLEAELLLASVLGMNRANLLAHDREEMASDKAQAFRELIARRADDEPLQYLLGSTSFMGLDFKVAPGVLIPRFDTEILVEEAITCLSGADTPRRILDVCTGSGAIAVSLAKYVRDSEVWASDLSPQALALAEENSQRLAAQVRFRQGDLLEPFKEAAFDHYFQLIASNPPYITTEEMAELPGDVRREPVMALWGGADGLAFYRRLARESGALLADEGALVMEIGFAQGSAVRQILLDAGFENVRIVKDWQDHDRVAMGIWRAPRAKRQRS